jgi:hypothetical protein
MLSEREVLSTLDNSVRISPYCCFIGLGHPYSYLVDCRLNIFKGDDNQWAIAAERLGHNPSAGVIILEIYYFAIACKTWENITTI